MATLQDWPPLFPDVQLEFGLEASTSTLRGSQEGVIVQRKRFSCEYQAQQVKWRMSDTQYAYFQSFHFYKLHQGTAFFRIKLPGVGGQQVLRRARFQDGLFEAVLEDSSWIVTAILEVEKGTSNV